jgi:hypothetical protein
VPALLLGLHMLHQPAYLYCCANVVQADNEQLESSLAAATAQVAALSAQLASLNDLQESLQQSLEGKQSAEAALSAQLTQARGELGTAQALLADAEAQRAMAQTELSAAVDRVSLLEGELHLKASRLDAAQQQLAADGEEHAAQRGLLAKQMEQLQVCILRACGCVCVCLLTITPLHAVCPILEAAMHEGFATGQLAETCYMHAYFQCSFALVCRLIKMRHVQCLPRLPLSWKAHAMHSQVQQASGSAWRLRMQMCSIGVTHSRQSLQHCRPRCGMRDCVHGRHPHTLVCRAATQATACTCLGCRRIAAYLHHPPQLTNAEAAGAAAAARVSELGAELDEGRAALDDSRAASAAQASRLAHLESQFEALQEVMGEGEQRDIVGRLLARISSLQAAAAAAEATRRSLHNQMVELRGNVRDDLSACLPWWLCMHACACK